MIGWLRWRHAKALYGFFSPCLTEPTPRSHSSTWQADPAVYMQCWWGLNRGQLLVPSFLSSDIASSNIFRGGCVVTNQVSGAGPIPKTYHEICFNRNYSSDRVEQMTCSNGAVWKQIPMLPILSHLFLCNSFDVIESHRPGAAGHFNAASPWLRTLHAQHQ